MKKFITLLLVILIGSAGPFVFSKGGEDENTIIIFHAGSLAVPFAAMKKEFEAKNKGIEILLESSGSQQAARKITDLNKPCDIIASADFRVIDTLLIPRYVEWNIQFATNQLVLCYTDKSRYSDKINEKNWFAILQRKGVEWGHSDPNLDPCGYRALMVMQLAERHYKVPGLYKALRSSTPKENIRPKSVELLSLLQTGNMDYAWEYLSVAVQHGLKYIALPDEINLGNYTFDRNYANASVMVAGERPGIMMEMKGESCIYGVAMLKNAQNRGGAVKFLAYLLDPEGGLKIFKNMGQPPLIPCRVVDAGMKIKIPQELHPMIAVGKK